MLELRRPLDEELNALDDRIGVADAFRFVRRWAVLLVVGAALGASIGAVYAALAEATYVANVRLLLERPRSQGLAGDPGLVQFTLDTSQIESQIQVILSESTTRRVVRELGLQSDPEFTDVRPSLLGEFIAYLRSLLTNASPGSGGAPWGGLASDAAPTGEAADDRVAPALAVLNSRLGARRIGQSYAIDVSFWSHYPGKAARIANSIAAAYIGNQLELRAVAAESGTELIARRLEDLRTQVAATQKAVRTGVIDVRAFPASDVRVITAASPPLGKSWPRTNLMIALGALIGLVSAGLLSIMLQKSRKKSHRLYL